MVKNIQILALISLLAIDLDTEAQVNKRVIGVTKYDLQSNSSSQRRIVVDPTTKDVVVTYTGSKEATNEFEDRGTGYARYIKSLNKWVDKDGADLSGYPIFSNRVESQRVGWPNPVFTSSKEIIISHISDGGFNGLNQAERVRGTTTNTWTNKKITQGVETWPRVASDGNNIVASFCYYSSDPSNPATSKNGTPLGIDIIVSSDGGTTWSEIKEIPFINSVNYPDGIGGDNYDIDIKGNTIVILTGRIDLTLYKSTDLGNTWTQFNIKPFTYNDLNNIVEVESHDGTFSVILDNNYKAHCFWGILGLLNGGTMVSLSKQGIGYWNEDFKADLRQPVIIPQTMFIKEGTFATSPIGRFNRTNRIDNSELSYWSSESYGTNTVTWPSVGIDASNNLYLSYAYNRGKVTSTATTGFGIDEDSTYGYNMYDIYLLKSSDNGQTWTGPMNISNTILQENSFPAIAKYVDDSVRIVYQEDGKVGTAVRGTSGTGSHKLAPRHTDNRIIYAAVNVNDIARSPEIQSMSPIMTVKGDLLTRYAYYTIGSDTTPRAILNLVVPQNCNRDTGIRAVIQPTKSSLLTNAIEIFDDQDIDTNRFQVIEKVPLDLTTEGVYEYRVTYNDADGNKPQNVIGIYPDTIIIRYTVVPSEVYVKLNTTNDYDGAIAYRYLGDAINESGGVLLGNNQCIQGQSITSYTIDTSTVKKTTVGKYKSKVTIRVGSNNYTAERDYYYGTEPPMADFNDAKIESNKVKATNTSEALSPDFPNTRYIWSYKRPKSNVLTSFTTTTSASPNLNANVPKQSFDSLCLKSENVFTANLEKARTRNKEICYFLKFTSSISNVNQTSFDAKFYPNPSNGVVNLKFEGTQSNAKANITIYDVMGKSVWNTPSISTESSSAFDLHSLGAGTYYIHTEVDGQVNIKKLEIK